MPHPQPHHPSTHTDLCCDQQIRDGVAARYTPADLTIGDMILFRQTWYPVVRVSAKSVSVPSIAGGPRTDTVRYEHLRDVVHADDVHRTPLDAAALAKARAMSRGRALHPAWQALDQPPHP